MNYIIFSEDRTLDRYRLVIDTLKNQGYNYIHSCNNADIQDLKFDFLIIDDILIPELKNINAPFIVRINNKSENIPQYERKNCIGFIDLDSNPLIIKSTLDMALDSILVFNNEHKKKTTKYHFSDFDITFFKTLPDGLVFQDKYGQILDINPAAETILSATKDQLMGVTSMDSRWRSINEDGSILEGKDHPAMIAIKTKKSVLGFVMGVFAEGNNVKWIYIDAIPVFDNEGEIDLVYTTFRDITQDKEKQNKLNLLSLAFEYSPISIFITNKDGVIESVNPKMIEITGYNSESLIGQNPRILQSENPVTDYINLWETIKSGSVWSGEFLNRKQNGDEYYESAIIAPVFNDDKEIINFVALKEDVTNVKEVTKKLEKTLLSMEEVVRERTKSLRRAQSLTLESLATLSEYRDNETGAHIQRTKLYVKFVLEKIKERLDYSDEEITQLWSSAPLHDIGKVAISDSILLKPGKLTVEEFDIMKKHALYGNEALMRVSERKEDEGFLRFAKEITLYHHEKWDGSGYPYGLSGEDIPISARLMALADVYDALRSVRPYKKSFSHEKSVNMILEQDGKHFDPELIKVFKEYNEDFNKIFNESTDYEIIFQSML